MVARTINDGGTQQHHWQARLEPKIFHAQFCFGDARPRLDLAVFLRRLGTRGIHLSSRQIENALQTRVFLGLLDDGPGDLDNLLLVNLRDLVVLCLASKVEDVIVLLIPSLGKRGWFSSHVGDRSKWGGDPSVIGIQTKQVSDCREADRAERGECSQDTKRRWPFRGGRSLLH